MRRRRRKKARRRLFEIFSGSGRLSDAVERLGWASTRWDIKVAAAHDLTRPSAVRRLLTALPAASWVHLGTPCASFSIARRGRVGRPGGPLRSRRFPMGIPGLSEADQSRVDIGNKLLGVTLQVIRWCLRRGVPVSLENPRSSRLWQVPAVKRLVARGEAVRTDYCQFGTPWRKSTTFAFWNTTGPHKIEKICTGRALCSRSHAKHVALSGNNPQGVPWTRVAEPYPRPLCRQLANAMNQSFDMAEYHGKYCSIAPER